MHSQPYLENEFDILLGILLKVLKRAAVSPVIATIVLVAIAVVGSTITAVFAQDAINKWQIGGYPVVELVTLTGFDARDAADIEAHNAPISKPSLIATFHNDGVKGIKEVITVYLKNDGTKKVVLDEVRLAGSVYSFSNPPFTVPFGSYAIIKQNLPSTVVLAPSPVIEPGQEVTLIFSLDSSIKMGRDLQFKLTTDNGFIVTYTVRTGEQKLI